MRLTIEASAGTGKTYELTTIVAAAIAGPGVLEADARGSGLIDTEEFRQVLSAGLLEPSELLLVTYTEAAARELKERVRERLAKLHSDTTTARPRAPECARLARALGEVDVMAISTIHGFCARIIREYGFELGVTHGVMQSIDEGEVARDLAMRWWSTKVRDHPEREQRCADAGLDLDALTRFAIESIGSRGIELAHAAPGGVDALVDELMRFARAEVGEVLRARGAMTFQDQLVMVLNGLRRSSRLVDVLRARTRLGIIDEAQDTDPVQLEIFSHIFDHGAEGRHLLVLVGDPKQAIYSFRGADLDAYLRMRGTRNVLRLDTNWRSEPGVVEAVNKLFGGENPFRRAGIEHPPVHAAPTRRHGRLVGAPPFEIEFGAQGVTAEVWTARTLHGLMAGGTTLRTDSDERPLRWGDCAVLGEGNRDLRQLDGHLRAAGVPTILLGDQSVYASDTVGPLCALLAACAEPGRAPAVRRAMISPLIGVSAHELSLPGADARVASWAARFAEWAAAAQRGGVLGIVERALASATVPVDSRTTTDALHLAELVHGEVGTGAGPGSMLMALERLAARHAEASTRPGDRMRRRIDLSNAVTLQTLHGSKGLEYGVVLMPWAGAAMVKSRAPLTLRVPRASVDLVGAEITAPAGKDPDESVLVTVPLGTTPAIIEQRQCEEAMRLLYVGVTRARHAVRLLVEHSTRARRLSALESLGFTQENNPWPPAVECQHAPAAMHTASADGVQAARMSAPRRSAATNIGRTVKIWLDRSFTRLSKSAHDDAPELAATAPEILERDDEPAPIVSRGALGGGRELGRIVHRIFEWAAREGVNADIRALTQRAIAEAAGAGGPDPELIVGLVERTRRADLAVAGGPTITLDALDPKHVAVELGFCLPLGHVRALTPEAMAQACAVAPPGSPLARFAPHAARLRFGEVVGFLGGNIDLLFEHEGRWWIVDYKTNDLGDRDEDYRAGRLMEAMVRDRYVMQYALYTVALRRLLTLRGVQTRGAWLGGVIYPFVRGVDPREPGRGLFVDHPTQDAIDAIDALLRAPPLMSVGGAA